MPTIFGKYTIEKKLGQGGMGAVYLALDPALNRRVALKIITSADPELLERFQREASAVAKLKHTNIIQVYESGIINKQHYFTMDYIEGVSLEKLISSSKRPNIKNMAGIIQQVASALHYAHSQSIIHRDIKPANILVDKSGKVYIADFGLAKQLTGLDRSLTLTGTTVGTPDYMPPEQAQGKKDEIDPRSDIFSLGATMYHCLTGRLPFPGKEIYEVLSKVVNDDPPTPSSVIKIIPKDLETICLKCLNKDKAKRYQTAEELAQDLKRYLEGGQITAKPTGVISKLLIKAAKNKTASLSIAGAAVILAIVAISLLVSSSNKGQLVARYRQEAQQAFDKDQYDQARAICNKLLVLSPGDEAIKSILKKCEKIIKEQEDKKQQKDAQAKEAATKAQRIADIRAQAKSILDRAGGAPTPDQKIQLARESLDVDPTYGDAWQVIGYAYREKEVYDKAVEAFTKAIKATPTLAYSYYERARITTNIYKKRDQAIPDFAKVLELDPNSDIGWFAKGTVEYYQEDYDKAISSYNKAIELNPNYAEAYHNRGATYRNKENMDQAIKDYNKVIELNPNYIEAYSNRGIAYWMKGDTAQAIKDWAKTIELDPKFAQAYYNRGCVYTKTGAIELAIKDFNKAMELDPNNASFYNGRGIAYSEKGDRAQAIKDYDKATELDPNDTNAYTNRGLVYKNMGKAELAIKEYDKAIELNPNHAKAYADRGNAYADMGATEQAFRDYDKAIELDPNYANSYINRGLAYLRKGELEQAIKDYDKAIELTPKDANAYANRGIVYWTKGDTALAIKDYDKAIELNPGYSMAYFNRGLAYYKNGDIDRAIADYDKVIELNPSYADAYGTRANAYANKKDYRQAIADMEIFFKLAPNHPAAANVPKQIEQWKKQLAQQEKQPGGK
ncbi:MAG: tetratricopeptide repeat protein [Planctomycetota bacterium]